MDGAGHRHVQHGRVSLVNGASTTVLGTVPSTQASLVWTVSGSTTTGARVRVECVGCASAVQDESDATFSIVAAAPPRRCRATSARTAGPICCGTTR